MSRTERPLLATLTRRARRQSCCGLCGRLILIGDHIGLTATDARGWRGWVHIACIIARNHDQEDGQ